MPAAETPAPRVSLSDSDDEPVAAQPATSPAEAVSPRPPSEPRALPPLADLSAVEVDSVPINDDERSDLVDAPDVQSTAPQAATARALEFSIDLSESGGEDVSTVPVSEYDVAAIRQSLSVGSIGKLKQRTGFPAVRDAFSRLLSEMLIRSLVDYADGEDLVYAVDERRLNILLKSVYTAVNNERTLCLSTNHGIIGFFAFLNSNCPRAYYTGES